MEKKSNKTMVIFLVVIALITLAAIAVLIVGITNYKNRKTENIIENNDNVVQDDNSISLNCKNEIDKTDISVPYIAEIVDNTVNIDAYTKKYSNQTIYEFTTGYCISPETTFAFEIENGILSLTNKNTGESSSLTGISNFKSLVYVKLFTSFYSYKIYLLTEDGKVYRSTISPEAYIYDTSNVNSIFQLIELPVNISEIGIIETVDVPATAEELLLKDENGIVYYGTESNFYKIS